MTDVLMAYIKAFVGEALVSEGERTAQVKRAVLYFEVSVLDQHPETQRHDLRQMAAERGTRSGRSIPTGSPA